MATWANAHANMPNTVTAVTDGTAIYGVENGGSGNWSIVKYEPLNGDAQTTIAPAGSPAVGQDNIYGDADNRLIWFKGHLYNVKHVPFPVGNANHRIDIYRYGGGTSWQPVESITPTSIVNDPLVSFVGNADFQLVDMRHATDNLFVVWVNVEDSSSAAEIIYTRYSTDGVNWLTATIDVTAGAAFLNYHRERAIFAEFTVGGADEVYEFAGGAWVERFSPLGTDLLDTSDRTYLWRANSTRTAYQYSVDGVTYTAPSDTAVQPVSCNALAPIGAKAVGLALKLHLWDPSTEEWADISETITTGTTGPMTADNFIRLNDGQVWCHYLDSFNEGWRTRSDPLGGPGRPDEEDPYAEGLFYYGRGKLVRRAAPPIGGVAIGGMVRAGKKVYIGSIGSNNVMVARAAAPFDAWEDLSAGLSTTSGIKAFSSTPWGEAQDRNDSGQESDAFQGGTDGKCE